MAVSRKRRKPAPKTPEKAAHTAVLRKLAPLAKHANAALEQASKAQTRSDDLRLTAAQDLAGAEKLCASAKGLSFKAWCEEHITQSWETARKLVRVGKSDNPAEAIADMRASEAKRQKKARAVKAAGAKGTRERVTSVQRQAGDEGNPYIVALDIAKALDDKDQECLAEEMANRTGMALVSAEQAKASDGAHVGKASILNALKALSVSDRRDVLRQLTEMVEGDARNAGIDPTSAVDMQPPAVLKRPVPKKRAKRKAA